MRNLFSVTIICLSFLTVGVFLSLSNNFQHLAKELSRNLVVVFFVDKTSPAPELKALEEKIKSSPLIMGVTFVSAEDARQRFRKNFPDLEEVVRDLETNPFPPSYEATLRQEASSSDAISSFIRAMSGEKGVQDVQFNRDWVEKMESLSRLVRAAGYFLGGILIFASFFIISNVIRLNVFARKEEILILRLVGATNAFIRIPFFLEGMALGIMGNAVSLLLLLALIHLFPVYLGSSLGALRELVSFRFLSAPQCISFLVGGAMIGLLGSLSALSRFLKD